MSWDVLRDPDLRADAARLWRDQLRDRRQGRGGEGGVSWDVLRDPDLRADAARLWPDQPWPETVIAGELIGALARVGLYDLTPTEPPFLGSTHDRN